MEALKRALNTTVLKPIGKGAGGCISEGEIYLTDNGKVFIKRNGDTGARQMFDGECESLKALSATGTVRVPKPFVVVDDPRGGALFAMEYLEFKGLHRKTSDLGTQLAKLHLHNVKLEEQLRKRERSVGVGTKEDGDVAYVPKFGFHVATCCGYLPQNNNWCDEWQTFYRRKIEQQVNWIIEKFGDREIAQLWSRLQVKLPDFFKGLEIKPSLLHGDLWSGNAGENNNEPVIFDAAAFYGHHEYDLAIMTLFGGFEKPFWDSYHKLIPRAEGWDERHRLYKLFHNLNHWNHFGTGYRGASLSGMKALLQ